MWHYLGTLSIVLCQLCHQVLIVTSEDASSLPPTPVYNTSILQDLCYNANAEFLSQQLQGAPSVQDAIALLKIWMHQRELDVVSHLVT